MNFEQWLKEVYLKSNGKPLTDASVEKYRRGLSTTSIELYFASKAGSFGNSTQ